MRLFVAVWPDEQALSTLRSIARPEVDGVRWMPESNWHVTLRFLGDIPEDHLESLVQALAAIRTESPIQAHIDTGSEILARNSLALRVTGLEQLAGTVHAAVSKYRQADERPFKGHITIARSRKPKALRQIKLEVEPMSWPVTDFALVRSIITSTGALYDTIAAFEIKDL